MQRLQRLGLLDANQFAGLPLDIPNLDVRKDFERRAKAVLQAPCPRGNTAKPSRRAAEKAHHAVRLAQRKCFQDDGFRFPGRHGQSARRRCAGQLQDSVRIARTRRTPLIIIRSRKTQSFPAPKTPESFTPKKKHLPPLLRNRNSSRSLAHREPSATSRAPQPRSSNSGS